MALAGKLSDEDFLQRQEAAFQRITNLEGLHNSAVNESFPWNRHFYGTDGTKLVGMDLSAPVQRPESLRAVQDQDSQGPWSRRGDCIR